MYTRVIADIDLNALIHNFHQVKLYAPQSKILAMVKGNAYGHGMLPVAQALDGVDFFGVATLSEVLALRKADITQPIVLMSGVYDEEALREAQQQHCQLVVHSPEQLHLLQKSRYLPTAVWIKVNTGMNRYGFELSEAMHAYQVLKQQLKIPHLYWLSHFACADEPNHPMVLTQIQRFNQLTQILPEPKSLANSAAILQYPQAHLEVVRPGLMLYGISPRRDGNAQQDGLQPVMTLHSKIVSIHHVAIGDTLGYSATWKAIKPSRIAVVSAGYADGYPQTIPNGTPVLVRGQRAVIAGRVSMDTLTIDITEIPEATVGDQVILWGKDLPIETIAQSIKGSVYGLLTGITQRAEYRYTLGA